MLKMSVVVLGLFSLKMRPGKTCGRHSTFGKALTIASMSIPCLRLPVATTFCMVISGLEGNVFSISHLSPCLADEKEDDDKTGEVIK